MIGHEDQPVEIVTSQSLKILEFAAWSVERCTEDQAVAMCSHGGLHASGHTAKKRIAYVWKHQTNRFGSAPAEAAGMRVRPVFQFLNGRINSGRRLHRKRQRTTEIARHCRYRDSCGFGNIRQLRDSRTAVHRTRLTFEDA